jgi:DNA-binding HxlR family transcriptional regulator
MIRRMLNSRYPAQVCSVARALEVVGERWSLLIVRDAMLGVSRFEEFLKSLGVARNILADRLETLVTEGVLIRRPYGSGQGRFEYALSDKGRALAGAVLALMEWGDRFYPTPGGPPRLSQHRDCGATAETGISCSQHGSGLSANDLILVPGPGSAGRNGNVTAQLRAS